MHLSEFKAWFEGFTEEMEKPPTPAQWKKIKARVKEITADYTPPAVFVDRYVYPYRRWFTDWTCLSAKTPAPMSPSNICHSMASISTNDWKSAGHAEFLSGTAA